MTENGPEAAGPGSVVLDIGEAIGAAVVTAPSSLHGRELEIRALHTEWVGRHVAFHFRETALGRINAAVFPQLGEGHWEVRLRSDEESPVVGLVVAGGRVSTVAFPR